MHVVTVAYRCDCDIVISVEGVSLRAKNFVWPKTYHRHSLCGWALLNRFLRSEVNGQRSRSFLMMASELYNYDSYSRISLVTQWSTLSFDHGPTRCSPPQSVEAPSGERLRGTRSAPTLSSFRRRLKPFLFQQSYPDIII